VVKNVCLRIFARKKQIFQKKNSKKYFFSKILQFFSDFFLENSDAHECAQECLAPKNTQINAPLNFPGAPWRIFGAPENLTKMSKISQQILSASFKFLGSRN